jgi:signal transduction histidine kinase/DNA-binding response OmpR family regulator
MLNETILIIDNSAESRSWLKDKVLSGTDYTLIDAPNLNEARAKLNRFHPFLMLIASADTFSDILAFSVEQSAATPLILIQPQLSIDQVQAALHAGVRDILLRPFEPNRLLKSIERVRAQRQIELDRAELLAQTKSQTEEFSALHAVGKKTAALLDLEEILTTVVSAAVALTHAEQGSLMLLDLDSGELYLRASQNLAEPGAQRLRIRVNDSLMGQVVQSGQPVRLSGTELVKIRTSFLVKALLSVPLLVGSQVIGVLSVDNKIANQAFDDHALKLLLTFADYAAIAIENARLYSAVDTERAKLETIVRDIQDAVIVVDPDMRILLVNNAARDAFHLSPEVLGQALTAVVHNSRVIDLFDQRKLRSRNWRAEIVLDDGRILQGVLSVLSGIGFGAVMQDISRLKELDRIKGEFVSIVSHDLRTPLTTIRGYVSLLPRAGPMNEQQLEFVQRVEQSMTNIVDLIADLLDIGKIEAGLDWEMLPTELHMVVQEAAQQLQSTIQIKQQVMIVKAPTLSPILGNARRLRQLVANLISNAIKYTPEHGRIEVSLREDEGFLVLQVSDNGVGISPEDQRRIFDKFFRVESDATQHVVGSGLGLSIVKAIAEKHDGRVWVQSELGKGSTFTVLLPKHTQSNV